MPTAAIQVVFMGRVLRESVQRQGVLADGASFSFFDKEGSLIAVCIWPNDGHLRMMHCDCNKCGAG